VRAEIKIYPQAPSEGNGIAEDWNRRQDWLMKIAIGIMAYNEERNIGAMISSLSEQTLFDLSQHDVSVHAVPNGCKDATAGRAGEAFRVFAEKHPRASLVVNEVAQAGKANAWNHFVHGFSSPDADALLLLDADIQFGERECLARVVEALVANPQAVVAVDLPLKDITTKSNLTLREQMSVSASQLQVSGAPKIAGSLYLARAAALRSFWMPLGLIVEDGFVKAMLLTDSFRQPEQTGAIVRAAGATHYFEAVTGFQAWFKHERRLVNGTAVNILLFSYIRELVAEGKNPGEVIRTNNEANPSWVADLAKTYRGPLPGAAEFVSEPLKKLGHLPFAKRLIAAPIALLRSALNVAVCIVCQGDVRAGRLRW
jgi:glycosyltransferase involved in cell wall biosynthesis